MGEVCKLVWLAAVGSLCLLAVLGCGETGKQQGGTVASQPATVQPQRAASPSPGGAAPASCYEIAFKVGRCAAKTMSNLPCEPGEDITLPPACKGKPETDKGLADGRKSVY